MCQRKNNVHHHLLHVHHRLLHVIINYSSSCFIQDLVILNLAQVLMKIVISTEL